MIVDDSRTAREYLSHHLCEAGYAITEAANGLEAMAAIEKEKPDAMVLDLLMPEMDGFEALHIIRETSNVPVIMLTAKAQDSEILRGFDVGADDYLTKPFNAKELVARIRAVLKRSRQSGSTDTAILTCGEIEIDSEGDTRVSVHRSEREIPREQDTMRAIAAMLYFMAEYGR